MKITRSIFLAFMFALTGNDYAYAYSSENQHHDHSMPQPGELRRDCSQDESVVSFKCALAPGLRFDRHGRLWVAWEYHGHIYISYSVNKGRSFLSSVRINSVAEEIYASNENRPKIAFGLNDEVYVSWTQKLPERFSGHIRFSRSTDGGKTFSKPIIVNDHLEITSHRFDTLGVNQQGHIYLAWLDKRDLLSANKAGKPYAGSAIYYTFSTDGGKSFSPNIKISDHSCECCRVAMGMDSDDLPVVFWRHVYGDNIRDHALVKLEAMEKPGDVMRISHDNWRVEGCPHHGPAISVDDQNVYHMVWFNNAPDRHGLFYAYSKDKGRTVSYPVNFGNYKKTASHADVIAIRNNVYLVWKEFDGKQSVVYTMMSKNRGASWETPVLLAQHEGDADYPFLVQDGSDVFLSWLRPGKDYELVHISQ